MNKKIRSLLLFGACLLVPLIFSEFFLRFYGTDLRIFLTDFDRKNRIQKKVSHFVEIAQNTGVSKETFNIYFLGESTMFGEPYGQDSAIPNIVNYYLKENLGGRIKAINLGSSAKDISYSHHVMKLLFREKEIFHPSLIVVYSGHNEFLKFHPTEPESTKMDWLTNHSELARLLLTIFARTKGELLEIDRRRFMDEHVLQFDRRGNDKVIRNYQKHLLEMVNLSAKNEIPFFISTLVSNYASWEPNRSVFCRSSQAKKQKNQFIRAFHLGREAEKLKDFGTALKSYEEALMICNSFSEVHFRLGKVQQQLHDYQKASASFQKAIDYDGMQIRAVSKQNDFIRSLDQFHLVQVVDSLAYLRKHTPNGLIDENLIIDGVHPNLEGYLLIGEAMTDRIRSLYSFEEKSPALDVETAKKIFNNIDQSKMFEVFYKTGRWIARLSTWRYDPAERLKTAESFFLEAIKIGADRPEGYLGLGIVRLLRHEVPEAESFLQRAQMFDPKSVDQYLNLPWIRKITRRAVKYQTVQMHTLVN